MAQHIDNYKVYLTDSKNYCTSYKILNEGIEQAKIEIIETIGNADMNKSQERKLYYIQNYECVNIKGKIKNKNNITKTEKYFIIGNLINETENNKNYTEDELRENLNKYQFYDENNSFKAILGYVNSILKLRKIKTMYFQKRINDKFYNRYKLIPFKSISEKTKEISKENDEET
jgi:hypothetical protein